MDEALHSEHTPKIIKAIGYAVAACRQETPPLLDKLKQHISIRALLSNVPVKQVVSAMRGSSLKTPYFWRLFARAQEETGCILQACSLWEECRRNAVQAGLFSENSPQVVATYLHIAALLHTLPSDELVRQRKAFSSQFKGYREYYLDQPPEIKAAVPRQGEERAGMYFLFPEQLYERAKTDKEDLLIR
ncbi:MAG: hypothetical protein HY730_01670 [Candidatus Tectomicrobia bacterium]|uniref:Uncharacterized protein n=1 Tax=Tectimicrobiota bacterium TaxID=2528274 RepID=A0A933GLP8_UNCTE|nr:hypothetical protein [Candidatus Tectomicrobia bacterium]